MAKAVRRPLAFLMWSEPPALVAPSIAFRTHQRREHRELNATERRLIRQAQRVQRAVAWLRAEFREETTRLPRFDVGAPAADAAKSLRSLLGVEIEEQCAWTSWARALANWRERVEALGILVFTLSLGKDSRRGMMLPDERAPVIIVNTAYNHAARIYSLFHELGHALSRTSSACGHSLAAPNGRADPVERWCEEVAAEALLPWQPVQAFLSDKGFTGMVENLDAPRAVARKFKVSLSAAVLRLIARKRARWSLWEEIPRTLDDKPAGGQPPEEPRTTDVIRLAEFGRPASATLIRGVESELLDRSQAASYLRVDHHTYSAIRDRVTAGSLE